MIGKNIDDGRLPCWGRFPSVRLATFALLHPGMSGPAVGLCWFRFYKMP